MGNLSVGDRKSLPSARCAAPERVLQGVQRAENLIVPKPQILEKIFWFSATFGDFRVLRAMLVALHKHGRRFEKRDHAHAEP